MSERETQVKCSIAPRWVCGVVLVVIGCMLVKKSCRKCSFFTRAAVALPCQARTLASGGIQPIITSCQCPFLLVLLLVNDVAPEQEIKEEVCRGEYFLVLVKAPDLLDHTA